jgi:predicted esterase
MDGGRDTLGSMDRILVRTLPATTLGRYLVEERSAGSPTLVGFHGYGETAEEHLAELRRLPGADRFRLAAVQALHRFYRTRTEEVVGSWMTKLDREQAIADNVAYVTRVVESLLAEQATPAVVYAGFSQGAGMAWRAAAGVPRRCHGLLVLGGDLPPDVAAAPALALPPVLIGRGVTDPYYTADKMAHDLAALRARGVRAETVVFDGGHVWGEPFREAAGAFLARVTAG